MSPCPGAPAAAEVLDSFLLALDFLRFGHLQSCFGHLTFDEIFGGIIVVVIALHTSAL